MSLTPRPPSTMELGRRRKRAFGEVGVILALGYYRG